MSQLTLYNGAIEEPRAQQLTSKHPAHERCVSITGSDANTYQISHSEKFDNLLPLNDPVAPGRPVDSVSLSPREARARSVASVGGGAHRVANARHGWKQTFQLHRPVGQVQAKLLRARTYGAHRPRFARNQGTRKSP